MAHIRLDKHGDDDDYNKIVVNNDRLYHSQIAVAHVRLAVRPADRVIVVRAGFGAFCGKLNSNALKIKARQNSNEKNTFNTPMGQAARTSNTFVIRCLADLSLH